MDLGLAGRAYVVTGGSRGLGRATAAALVAEGARVVVSARGEKSLAAAATALGEGCVTVAADNADPETPARLIATARERFGRLDGALISVGGPGGGTFAELSDASWEAAFESVFMGTVRLLRALATELDVDGAIALVLSSTVRQPIPGLAASNGLRPGLAMIAKQLADELGPRGVRVNTLLPGRIDTDRVRQLDGATGDPAAAQERTRAQIPLGRYGLPREFGDVAAFVLSPAASYLTGVTLPIDGGMLRGL